MPRQARIDYPGALHHVIGRGINRSTIFCDELDLTAFTTRLEDALLATDTQCHAWTLMPNHFHLLLITGKEKISKLMHSLLTSYAIYFNKRHDRIGHLFQNRYKSILCDIDSYHMELIRYINLNPLRGGLVKTFPELGRFKWSSHRYMLGTMQAPWFNPAQVLSYFHSNIAIARSQYLDFLLAGTKNARKVNYEGGGLIRSNGGAEQTLKSLRAGEKIHSDSRILGDSNFVAQIEHANLHNSSNPMHKENMDLAVADLLNNIATKFDITPQQISSGDLSRNTAIARAIASALLHDKIGLTRITIAQKLQRSTSGITKSIKRGRKYLG